MTAYRVSFDIDLSPQLGSFAEDPEKVRAYILKSIIHAARDRHKEALQSVQSDSQISAADKASKMAARLQAIMAATQAEANLVLDPLPAGTVVNAKLPFEHEDA